MQLSTHAPSEADCCALRVGPAAACRLCVLFLMLRFLFNGCFQAGMRAYGRRCGEEGCESVGCWRSALAVTAAERRSTRPRCSQPAGRDNPVHAASIMQHLTGPARQAACGTAPRAHTRPDCGRASVTAAPRVCRALTCRSKGEQQIADKVEEELWVTLGGMVSQ